jgi:hypothetical protein
MIRSDIPGRGGPAAGRLRPALLAALAVALGLLVGAAPAAAAGKKVAIDLEGPAAKVEKTVKQILADEGYEVIGSAAYKKAAKKARGQGDEAIARAAKRLGASAVIIGSIEKKGKKTFLILSVHNGLDGALIDALEIALKGTKPDADAIITGLPAAVKKGKAAAGGGSGGDDEGGGEPAKPTRAAPVERAEPTETPAADTRPAAPAAGLKRMALDANIGMSMWARRMSVSPAGSADVYNGKPVPGLRFDGELYPVAFFANTSWAADFGIGFFVDMAWLSSQLAGGGSTLATTQQRWGVDLRWRYQFTGSATSPVARIGFSIQHLAFNIGNRASAPADLNVPDVGYMSYAPSIGFLLPLGTPSFRIGAYFSYLITSATESNSLADRGLHSSWGLDFGVHLDYLPLPWLLARAQFGLTSYSNSYTPAGAQTITGMSDMYIGGLVTLGYVY